MSDAASASSDNPSFAGRLAWAAWIGTAMFLIVCVAVYVVYGVHAVRFPYGLDYAEGEVWEQAVLMTGDHAYGDINRYPYICFEYPPVYHLLALALTAATHAFLASGRIISMAAAAASAGLIGFLAAAFDRTRLAAAPLILAGLVAGCLTFTLQPIEMFSTLARVDMLQTCLSLTGMALSVAALRRPKLLFGAVLIFVVAGFTKQVALAAPFATLVVMTIRTPKIALSAFAAGGVLAGTVVGVLNIRTHGGFLRHIILYNVEHFTFLHYLAFAVVVAGPILMFLGLVTLSVLLRWRHGTTRARLWHPIRHIREDEAFAVLVLMTLYLLATTALTLLAGKAGSSVNYFVEFLAVCCVWVGALVTLQFRFVISGRPAALRALAAIAVPGCVMQQCWPVPAALHAMQSAQFGPAKVADRAALLDRLRGLDKPILSDDMALVMVAGKSPPIEPYVFAKLAASGLWDEGKLVDLLNRHAFSAVLTYKDPGNIVFDDRFGRRTIAAIQANYPVVARFDDDRLRLPR